MSRATLPADATRCPNCGGALARVAYCGDVVACGSCRETWYAGDIEPDPDAKAAADELAESSRLDADAEEAAEREAVRDGAPVAPILEPEVVTKLAKLGDVMRACREEHDERAAFERLARAGLVVETDGEWTATQSPELWIEHVAGRGWRVSR